MLYALSEYAEKAKPYWREQATPVRERMLGLWFPSDFARSGQLRPENQYQ
jgi:hypothetical protein